MKNLAQTALGFAFMGALLLIPVAAFLGLGWAAKHSPIFITAGWVILFLDLLILFPLSLFKRLRGFTGGAIVVSAYLFGLITFLMSVAVTWMLWGGWAVGAGLLLFGGTIFPIAVLAAMFKGMWSLVLVLIVLLALTIGAAFAGVMLRESHTRI
uniref:hypothetical protein n=1 Tax=Cupriavidus yeoncheonensis TaxID=1462994 RepID=UPI003F495F8B